MGLGSEEIIVILQTEKKKTLFIYGFHHHSSVILAVVQYTCAIIAWLRYNLTDRKDSLQNTLHWYIKKRPDKVIRTQWIYQYDTRESYNYKRVISEYQFTIKLVLAHY